MDDQTTRCSNCKRDIATNNFTMHELHCHRNIVLCQKCNEPVPRAQLKEHDEANHSFVKCSLCSADVERPNLAYHEEQLCEKRLVKCPVCEMEVTFDSFVEHLDYCESRTQECPLCHQFIMMKDLEEHEASNCQLPERVTRRQSAGDTAGELGTPVFNRESSFAAKEIQRMLNFQGNHPFGAGMSMDYNFMNDDYSSRPDFLSDSTMLPCEFCNNLFTSDMILAHQSSCPRDPSVPGNRLASMLRAGMTINQPRRTYHEADNDDDDDIADRAACEDDSMLPCEFCEELYPMSEIPYHQSSCARDTLSSARGPRPIQVSDVATRADEIPTQPQINDLLRPIAVRRHNPTRSNMRPIDTRADDMVTSDHVLHFRDGMWSDNVNMASSDHPQRRITSEIRNPNTGGIASRNIEQSTRPVISHIGSDPSRNHRNVRNRGSGARNIVRRDDGHRNTGNSRSRTS